MTKHGPLEKYSCLKNPMNSVKKLGSHLPYKRPPRWLSGKEFTCQSWRCRSHGLIPGSGRCPRGGNGNTVQYPCLENPMDRRAWHAMVHGVAKNWTWLNNWMCMHYLIIMHSDAHFFLCGFLYMFHFTKRKWFKSKKQNNNSYEMFLLIRVKKNKIISIKSY